MDYQSHRHILSWLLQSGLIILPCNNTLFFLYNNCYFDFNNLTSNSHCRSIVRVICIFKARVLTVDILQTKR